MLKLTLGNIGSSYSPKTGTEKSCSCGKKGDPQLKLSLRFIFLLWCAIYLAALLWRTIGLAPISSCLISSTPGSCHLTPPLEKKKRWSSLSDQLSLLKHSNEMHKMRLVLSGYSSPRSNWAKVKLRWC